MSETLLQVLDRHAALQGEATALRLVRGAAEVVEQIDFRTLIERALDVAALLTAEKLHGERVLLLFPHSSAFVTAFLGCLYAGVVAVPLALPRPRRPAAAAAVARDCAAAAALTSAATYELLAGMTPALPRLLPTDVPPAGHGADGGRPRVRPADLAVLQYTSGATGSPKGVRITHRNLLANQRMIQRAFRHGHDAHGLSWLPLFHDMGLFGGLLQPLFVGASATLMSPLDFVQQPVRWLQAISALAVHSSGGPNFGFELCAERVTAGQKAGLDLSGWRRAFTGAEQVSADTLDRFTDAFAGCGFRRSAFLPCYGMAEATLFVTGIGDDRPPRMHAADAARLEQGEVRPPQPGSRARRLVACGPPARGIRLEIVDPLRGTPQPPGCIGELWISGPSVAGGYWHPPGNAAEDPFQGWLHHPDGRRDGPFYRTGDLGLILDGELVITGRVKEVIILAGRNHYPQDIETTVQSCHAAVPAGGVAAFAFSDEGQESLALLIEIEAARRREPDLARELFQAVLQAVSEEHGVGVAQVALVPRGQLPRTTSHKIRRLACAQAFAAGELDCLASLRPLAPSPETAPDRASVA